MVIKVTRIDFSEALYCLNSVGQAVYGTHLLKIEGTFLKIQETLILMNKQKSRQMCFFFAGTFQAIFFSKNTILGHFKS